jgi:hypothetical protein
LGACAGPPYPRTDHFDGSHFHNPAGAEAKGLAAVVRWKLTSIGRPEWNEVHARVGARPPARSETLRFGSAPVGKLEIGNEATYERAHARHVVGQTLQLHHRASYGATLPRRESRSATRPSGARWSA